MANLVTLEQAKLHLQLLTAIASPLSDQDEDLQMKLDQAHELVLDYVSQRRDDAAAWAADVAAWTSATAPRVVIAAILRMVGHLWRWRGDDEAPPQDEANTLPRDVRALLSRLRDPALS